MAQIAKTSSTEAFKASRDRQAISDLIEAAQSCEPVSGLTHNSYRYPARFSPAFARAAILAFTKPGDTVFDPFMGGGTTLVEASVLGRRAVGTDINPLAVFVARAKTTPLSQADLVEVFHWASDLVPDLNLRYPAIRATRWAKHGYQRNISSKSTWPIRKILELALGRVKNLRLRRQRRFARCVLLRTSQWALDCRETIPPAKQFRQQFLDYLGEMTDGVRDYSAALTRHRSLSVARAKGATLCLSRSVIGVETDRALAATFPPALILTSPPYPGVHMLYHRWQVQGRRETPAPFWIVGSHDGNGESYYTFGNRKCRGLGPYYEQLSRACGSLARIADHRTVLVQMVAFSDRSWQLPKYLSILQRAGFTEMKPGSIANSEDGRVWRSVPHRKWYADQRGRTTSRNEVVLFHRLA